MPEGAPIELQEVSKVWGSDRAVDKVSFAIEPGQFVILLGPSGCGKSTTLRMIAGLESVTEGAVFIDGRDVTDLPPSRRGIAMVFQSYALFPHLSVAENIVFGLKSRRVPKAEREDRLKKTAELVGLTPFLDRKPAYLSGGQRQRVALARAIISENRICLMDEPLSNLDARLRSEMRRELKALQKRLGMTVIYVTHDQVEAMSMGDRVILMQGGELVQDGTPDRLYSKPATTFAASFLGSPPMNLVPLDAQGGTAIVRGLAGYPLGPAEIGGCWLGVRPEDLIVGERSEPGLPAEVLGGEYLGADTVMRLRLGESEVLARLPGRADTTPGRLCSLSWATDSAHLFDGESGRRLDQWLPALEQKENSAAGGETPADARDKRRRAASLGSNLR